jgi:hypothetical protein
VCRLRGIDSFRAAASAKRRNSQSAEARKQVCGRCPCMGAILLE